MKLLPIVISVLILRQLLQQYMTQIEQFLNASSLQQDEQAISPVLTISQVVPSRIENTVSSSSHHR
jgi:hypothetical protein